MKKFLFLILCFFASVQIVSASSIDSIDMDIVLDEYGTATVTETWKANVTQGTEGWHPYYNIDDSTISVVSASMDGIPYTVLSSWNEGAGLDGKAYKAGIYSPQSNETDVVFGITNYGEHTYKVVYEITNFVKELEDADMIYWQLYPYDFSSTPSKVTIKVTGPEDYPDTLDVWGFGMYGALCYVDNGAIYMDTDNLSISSSDYLVLLAKFPKGTFNTTSKLDNNFDHYLNMAKDGARAYKEDKTSIWDIIIGIFSLVFQILIWAFVIGALNRTAKKSKVNYNFGEAGKTLPKDKDVNNFREIPCNKDVYRAFWVADTYGLVKNKNDFLGVLLLKWIYDGNVTVQTNTSKKIFKDKKEDVIIFNKEPEANDHERNLYRYMLEASGDGVLEKDEFKKWCKKHYSKVLDFADKVLKYEREALIKEGKIVDKEIEKGLAFKYKVHEYVVDPSMKEEAIQMKGLKKFLIEFSQIKKKEPIEVKLWNEYLMYAQIFGIADKVMERFKDLYPEIVQDMEKYNFDYGTFMFVHSVSTTGVSAASAARSAAQSYSSGGGGFSSGGGGGGSFGGGGGGGGFR